MKPHYLKDTIIKTFNEFFEQILTHVQYPYFYVLKSDTSRLTFNAHANHHANKDAKRNEKVVPGFFSREGTLQETSYYNWHAVNDCEHSRVVQKQPVMSRLKLPELPNFTFGLSYKEFSHNSFKVCDCMKSILPSKFNFKSHLTYKRLNEVENNSFINSLKIFLYALSQENYIETLCLQKSLTPAKSLYGERAKSKLLQENNEIITKTLLKWRNALNDLPFELEHQRININQFVKTLTVIQKATVANLEKPIVTKPVEYLQNYYLTAAQKFNETAHVDETLIVCNLRWYKEKLAGTANGENVYYENFNEIISDRQLVKACNYVEGATYDRVHLYKDLMDAYSYKVIENNKTIPFNNIIIMLPAEIYKMLQTLVKTRDRVSNHFQENAHPFRVTPAFGVEITKEKFEDEAFLDTLVTLFKDDQLSFSETVKTALTI